MRKQCLFDPNHLIDELGYTKHLLNCQSKLKKDWRKCRYDNSHWHLYKSIDFHEKFQCPSNPLCIQDPRKFYCMRQYQIKKRLSQANSRNNDETNLVLSKPNRQTNIFLKNRSQEQKNHQLSLNFGSISVIEKGIGSNSQNILTSQVQTIENHQFQNFQTFLSFSEGFPSSHKCENNQQICETKVYNKMQKRECLIFEESSQKMQTTLWKEPDFLKFQKGFRQKWFVNKQKDISNKKNQYKQKEEYFYEQMQELQITIKNVRVGDDFLDYD